MIEDLSSTGSMPTQESLSTPSVSFRHLVERRVRLLNRISQIGNGVALFFSAPEIMRPQRAPWEYRQNSDLYYVTGYEEPRSMCLLSTVHPEHHFVLFVQPHDLEEERWTGLRAGISGAVATFGADAAYSIDELDTILPNYLQGVTTLYCDFGQDETHDRELLQLIKCTRLTAHQVARGPTILRDIGILLDDLCLIKQPEEQADLRKAAGITVEAHCEVMRKTHPGQHEYELQALAEYIFRRRGAPRNAYPSIIGSGPNATILHYQANTRQMQDGDLVLVDAAAEYGYYAMDLTRTIPVNGKFTEAQRTLYTIVLAAEHAALDAVHPGNTLADVHAVAVRTITAGLEQVGILRGDVENLISSGAYKPYFMHSTSHLIGLDIRDRGQYVVNGQSRRLEPGMVFSIEPGLYISPSSADTQMMALYRNIGIRIEDTVIVTADGCEILTSAAPKDPDAIEALMASGHN